MSPPQRAGGSIVGVALVFAAAGVVMAQVMARIPALRDQVGASESQLGVALLGGGLGSLLAMPFAARLVERWGVRRVTTVAAMLGCAGWASVSTASSPWMLLALLVLTGAPVGVWDVAMNIRGSQIEAGVGRSLMPYLHAAFSGGAVLGAAIGALAAWQDIDLRQLVAGAALALVIALVGLRTFDREVLPAEGYPPVAPTQPAAEQISPQHPPAGAARRGITVWEILIGIVCLGAAVAEGAANDWLALLLVDVHGAPASFGAVVLMAFNLTMMTGRLLGAPAIDRWGRVAVVRAGGVLAASGIVLAISAVSLPLALVGGLLWGLGVSSVFPAAMSAAAEIPGRGSRAIGVVSTIGYGAFLVGAPTIGLLAGVWGLDRALLAVVGVLTLMVALAAALRSQRATLTSQVADRTVG